MSNENTDINAAEILEDGVITGSALRHLSEEIQKHEDDEKILNGTLSMVCTYPEVSSALN
jgi:hypothetical protein